MISSTFYDLKQVRADLVSFLADDLGFLPLVSERSSFPVDPDLDTIENCRRRVDQDADLLILVVGGRYGHVDGPSAKSVTNLEYLAAKAKGIPIYPFVKKSVLSILPVYKRSPEADFSDIVDDRRVFDFIIQVREVDQLWCHEFDLAQEIIATLRQQLAYLAYEGISLRRQLHVSPAAKLLGLVSGQALRYALERPKGWEFRLFAAALEAEVAKRKELRRQHELGISFGTFKHVQLGGVEAWFAERHAELEAIISSFDTIVNVDLRDAMGVKGEDGDAELIAFVARSLGRLYEEAIDWSMRWRRTSCDELLVPAKQKMSVLLDGVVEKIEVLAPELHRVIREMDETIERGEEPERRVIIDLDLPGADEALAELRRLQHEIQLMAKEAD